MILVVDSERSAVMSVKQVFEELGLQSVRLAKSAQEAKQVVEEYAEKKSDCITLIIIDSKLEDANGYELCRELRKMESTTGAYIMMLVSSAENKTAIENARNNGASGFAVKPYASTKFYRFLIPYIKQKSVLLIDDDPLIRQMVRRLLDPFKVEISEVDDGRIANNLLNSMLPPGLILMDIGLPNFNGIQLVTKIRSKPEWKKTPIVMITSSTDAVDVKKSLGAGANDYIAKPFKPDEFRARMSRYLDEPV